MQGRLWPILVLIAASWPADGLDSKTTRGPWATWSVRPEPVFNGQIVASDPCVVRDGDLFRMFYTGGTDLTQLDAGGVWFRLAMCEALSEDGLTWRHAPIGDEYKGLVLRGEPGRWDEILEACFMVKSGEEYRLYYCGYVKQLPASGVGWAQFGLACSRDGLHFERDPDNPILKPTPGGYDNDMAASPTLVREGDTWYMVYCGHNYTEGSDKAGVRLLGATSSDGLHWIKRGEPVLEASKDIPWMNGGAAEPDLVKGADGKYYLFFTGLGPTDVPQECLIKGQGGGRVIGVAQGPTPFGPWDVNPEPIVKQTPDTFDESAAIAPTVLVEGDKARLWYHGFDRNEKAAVGYAESAWPLRGTPEE